MCPFPQVGSEVGGNLGRSPKGLFLPQTWTSRCLMKFYAVVAASPTSWESHKIAERIEQRILNSNPVMEAFGKLSVLWDLPLSRKRRMKHCLWGLEEECIIHCLGLPISSRRPEPLSSRDAVIQLSPPSSRCNSGAGEDLMAPLV